MLDAMNMYGKFLLIGAAVAAQMTISHGFCIPCFTGDLTLSSFTDCHCEFGQLYDSQLRKCVPYDKCSPVDVPNFLKEFQSILPNIRDIINNSLENLQFSSVDLPEDFRLAKDVLKNRIDRLKRDIPEMLTPTLGPIILKDKTILEKCKTDPICALLEALKRKEIVKEMLPKLKPILGDLLKQFLKYFDDLYGEVQKKGCSYFGHCPGSKAVTDAWKKLPPVDDVSEFQEVLMQAVKFLGGDNSKLSNLFNLENWN